MCKLTERSHDRGVLFVVEWVLQVVALRDLVLAVGVVGFVGGEVYFAEQSGMAVWLVGIS